MAEIVIKPRIRGFICTTSHPDGCAANVKEQLQIAWAARNTKPDTYRVLVIGSSTGYGLASRIAARLKLGLTGDAIDLEINDKDQLVQLKPALGGNVIAPILSKTLPNLVTLRPGLLSPIAPEEGATAPIETIASVTCEGAAITLLEEHQQDLRNLSE